MSSCPPGHWERCTATRRAARSSAAGAIVETNARVDSLDDLDADAIIVATPPDETARLLDEPDPRLEPSPIVSIHLLFDRPLLAHPLAALLGSDAHWVFDRGAPDGKRAGGRSASI